LGINQRVVCVVLAVVIAVIVCNERLTLRNGLYAYPQGLKLALLNGYVRGSAAALVLSVEVWAGRRPISEGNMGGGGREREKKKRRQRTRRWLERWEVGV